MDESANSALTVLMDQTHASTSGPLPTSHVQLNEMLWNAFHRGQQYARLGGDEAVKVEFEKAQKAHRAPEEQDVQATDAGR